MTEEKMFRALSAMRESLPQWAPKDITPTLCSTWMMVLADFSDEQIGGAFKWAISELTEWPAPSVIKRFLLGSNKSDQEIGQDIASRIEGGIQKFGYTQPEQAEKYLGPIGWQVVSQLGGWRAICEVDYDQLPSARKQWRELATIISKNFHTTGANLPPALPTSPQRDKCLTEALRIAQETPMKKIPVEEVKKAPPLRLLDKLMASYQWEPETQQN